VEERSRSEGPQFRYSVWPGGQIELPEIVPWQGEVDWPWFPADPHVSRRARIAAPTDLHVFEFGNVEPTRASLEEFCRSVGLPATRTGRAWADIPVGRYESGARDFYGSQIAIIASYLGLEVPDFSSGHPDSWHAAELFFRIDLVHKYVATLHALHERQPIAPIWSINADRLPAELSPERFAWAMFEFLLNAGLAEFQIRVSSGVSGLFEREPPSAYEVACLAVANDLATRAPYRVCANEACRRVFPRQRGRAQHGQFRTQGVAYCTPECSRAQSQRDRRRKARQPEEKHDG
jgi:hypothetical protein